MDPKIKELVAHLNAERDALAEYGYRFPALFDAVQFLLERAEIRQDTSADV